MPSNTMVVKRQELVCWEWASRKSEWENLTILRTAVATAFAANLAAKDYYRISFDHADGGAVSCKGLRKHLPKSLTFEIAATEDLLNNNVLEEAKTNHCSAVRDLIEL